jgi:hypothetical protein
MGDLPVVLQSQDLKGTLTSYFCEQNGTQYSTSRKGSPADFPLSYPTSVVLFSFSTALAGKFSSLQSTYAISYLNLGSIIRHVTFTMKPVIMASIVFQFTLRLTTNELPPKLMVPFQRLFIMGQLNLHLSGYSHHLSRMRKEHQHRTSPNVLEKSYGTMTLPERF